MMFENIPYFFSNYLLYLASENIVFYPKSPLDARVDHVDLDPCCDEISNHIFDIRIFVVLFSLEPDMCSETQPQHFY